MGIAGGGRAPFNSESQIVREAAKLNPAKTKPALPPKTNPEIMMTIRYPVRVGAWIPPKMKVEHDMANHNVKVNRTEDKEYFSLRINKNPIMFKTNKNQTRADNDISE